MSTITDRGTTITVTLTEAGLRGVPAEPARDDTAQDYLRWYTREAEAYGCARVRLDGADRKIARELLQTYGMERLRYLTVHFLRRHADPLLRGEYHRHMILFKAQLPEVEKDLETQAH